LNLTRNILCIFHVRCLGSGILRSMVLGVLAENAIHVFLCTQKLRVKFMTRCAGFFRPFEVQIEGCALTAASLSRILLEGVGGYSGVGGYAISPAHMSRKPSTESSRDATKSISILIE